MNSSYIQLYRCVYGNGNGREWELRTRESHGNGNESKSWEWDGREWELNRWEWEGLGMLKAIPAHLYYGASPTIAQCYLPPDTGECVPS